MDIETDNALVNHTPSLSIDSTAEETKTENAEPLNGNLSNKNQNLNQVWTKETFKCHQSATPRNNYLKASLNLDLKPLNTSWASKKFEDSHNNDAEEEEEMDYGEIKEEVHESTSPVLTPDKETPSPSHHARRPMNAFLIFCKKHRPIVRQKFPHLENRGVTRILGEWWALLDVAEKSSYTTLAKEYKDAFFSANPDFKWYKLPAPPLRTLSTRPVGIPKPASPLASPTQLTLNSTEFTPGKLADETQLGNLTSLMSSSSIAKSADHNNCALHSPNAFHFEDSKSPTFVNNNNVENESEQHKQLLTPKNAAVEVSNPPKPIKKRKLEEYINCDNNKIVRDIFNVKEKSESFQLTELDQNDNSYIKEEHSESETYVKGDEGLCNNESENMTQQELMNKVVDSMFPEKNFKIVKPKNGLSKGKQKSKETRKSGRSCKGKRYAEFMIEGKLLGNKQAKKVIQDKVDVNNKFDDTLNTKIEHMMHNKNETQTPTLNLGNMIKRLAERTNVKLEDIDEDDCEDKSANDDKPEVGARRRTESENSEDGVMKSQSNFNLDLRISELPCLSYEVFLQRKKESKKRKSVRSKSESSVTKTKAAKLSPCENFSTSDNFLVGSKKRKNKNSITRLEKPSVRSYSEDFSNDLLALATLAEVAANTQKIN